MNPTRLARTAATAILLAFVLAPAVGAFVVPPADEVQLLVEMPLAVTRVVEVGVPEPEVEAIVLDLNRTQVPAYDAVELLRYAALDLFLDSALDLGGDLGLDFGGDDPILLVLLGQHIDAGLVGQPLANAVFLDLDRLGVPLVERRRTRTVARQPVVLRERFVAFDQGTRLVRDGDRLVARDRDGRIALRRDRDRRIVGDRLAVPPGHAKHGPDGPHPTPGHVKHHDGPDANPGHARGDDRRRASEAKPPGKPGKAEAKSERKAERKAQRKAERKDRDGGPGKARAQGKGNAGGQGKGKADGKGKGGGNGKGGGAR